MADAPGHPAPDHEDAVPLCLHCLNPVSPLAHICPTCAHSSGQFTTYMPFEQIPFFAECIGALWRRFWFGRHFSVAYRLFCCVLIGITYPLLFLAAPIALWQLATGRHPERPSEPVTRPA
ncbi:MAG: hypothetical protein IT431_10825 [Phycisphaerales bacterium]|nr:hypothetical protein [Phycisphaerales bacterium]